MHSSFFLCTLDKQLCLLSPTRHLCSALSMPALYLMSFRFAWPCPQHALPPMLTHTHTHKTSASEGNLLFFHAGTFLHLLSCCECDINISLSPCVLFWNSHLCYPFYMMLLLYYRPVTEKKTPLLRNHSICSGPQRFTFVFNYSAFWNIYFQWFSLQRPFRESQADVFSYG